MHFEESLKFEGDPDEVWKRASAVGEIPNYWRGTKMLEVVGEQGGVTRVKVKFAFGGSGEADVSVEGKTRTVTIDYRSGPFIGKQVLVVGDGSVSASWDVSFRGFFRLASKWNEGHFRSGTVHALQRLATGEGVPQARAPDEADNSL